jgi:hypothetical protein
MAKKKKSAGGLTKAQPALTRSGAQDHGAGYLWLAAIGGMVLVVLFLVLPWVTVLAESKSSLGLVLEAFSKKEWETALAVAFTLVPALVASVLPFTPPSLQLRERLGIFVVVASAIDILILSILSRSTRNILALGAGRQAVGSEIALFFVFFGVLAGGAIGYLLNRDLEEEGASQAGWYAALILVIFAAVYFNYSTIPNSLIPPPEYIRQRMEFME